MRRLLLTLLQIFATTNASARQQKQQQQTHKSHHLFVKVGIKITMLKKKILKEKEHV